jgi:hypothetical protein
VVSIKCRNLVAPSLTDAEKTGGQKVSLRGAYLKNVASRRFEIALFR